MRIKTFIVLFVCLLLFSYVGYVHIKKNGFQNPLENVENNQTIKYFQDLGEFAKQYAEEKRQQLIKEKNEGRPRVLINGGLNDG